ncbi:MAG: HU family DNA-binding protein [Ktedonobacteraceae bacterium]
MKNLEQREKAELIAIIQHMLRQEPELQWLLMTPLPTTWVDSVVETLYESFKDGKGVTFPGFSGFYVRPEPESWVFKFNPGQRLRALFGWSSTYSGTL